MPNNTREMIETKVRQTLKRLEIEGCRIRDVHDGRLLLDCPNATRNDQSLIQAAMRVIAGVKSVEFESTANNG